MIQQSKDNIAHAILCIPYFKKKQSETESAQLRGQMGMKISQLEDSIREEQKSIDFYEALKIEDLN